LGLDKILLLPAMPFIPLTYTLPKPFVATTYVAKIWTYILRSSNRAKSVVLRHI